MSVHFSVSYYKSNDGILTNQKLFMKKSFNSLISIIITALFLTNLSAATKPNVLFIFADDQCYKTINSLNNKEIKTPNLDKLVGLGTTFTHAYNMGGYHGAVCVASRTMLVTGKYIWHAKNSASELKKSLDGSLWPQLMAKSGYETFFTGKWHIKADANHVFGTARHVRGGMPKQTPQGYNRPLADGTDPWDPSDPKFGGFWAGGKHWSEVVADDAIDYLDASKKTDNPFFMYIAFNAPHDPRQAPKKYVNMYPTEKIQMPASFLTEHPYKEQIGCSKGLRDEKLAPFPRTKHAVQVNRREYYAIITHMDAQIGRILKHLESTGQSENTYIFFTADHGLSVGHHGLLGKQNLYDHSVRVPFIAVGPGIDSGKKNHSPIYMQDVMATALEIAESEVPKHVQFKSLMPMLNGKKGGLKTVYGAYVDFQRMAVSDQHKLLLFPKIKKAQLFDLKKDPEEMQDISGKPESKEKMKSLFKELLRLQKKSGDKLNLIDVYPELAQN